MSSSAFPLVTVMIATRDRGPELRKTLQLLAEQEYAALELVVIDDGSREPIEPIVRESWPAATVIRHEESRGQCQRRNEGFARARGEFILHLDDDCCFTRPGDLAEAIRKFGEEPGAGAMVFDLFNGPVMPAGLRPSGGAGGCVVSFVGAAVLFRTIAIRQTMGYRPFFVAQHEEEELSLQLLQRGWRICFYPKILAHHRLSNLNRNTVNTWRRGLRNNIWILMLHMPARRCLPEAAWKLFMGAWDAIRLFRFRAFCGALRECAAGAGGVWRLRKPLSPIALRRYDALRMRHTLTDAEFDEPPGITIRELQSWWAHWRNRGRDTSVWEKGASKGRSHISRHAHDFAISGRQAPATEIMDPKPK